MSTCTAWPYCPRCTAVPGCPLATDITLSEAIAAAKAAREAAAKETSR